MTHSPLQLKQAMETLQTFSERAALQGRSADATVLSISADVLRQALIAFATPQSFVSEDPAARSEIVCSGYFSSAEAVGGWTLDAEWCPYSWCGICPGCGWKDTQWIQHGKLYECATRRSIHNQFGRLSDFHWMRETPPDPHQQQTRQDRAGRVGTIMASDGRANASDANEALSPRFPPHAR